LYPRTVFSSLKLTPLTTFSWNASLPPGSPNTLSDETTADIGVSDTLATGVD